MPEIEMGVGTVMRAFVNAFLPWPVEEKDIGLRDNTVLVMSLDLRVRLDFEARDNQRIVHLMFHRPANYIRVLWAVVNPIEVESVGSYYDIPEWTMKSDHDSAWVSDGIETPLRRLAREMLEEIDPNADFNDCDISLFFSMFDPEPKIVRLESHKLDRNSRTFMVKFAPRS